MIRGVPYDAEVEYLVGQRYAYIDTGMCDRRDDSAESRFAGRVLIPTIGTWWQGAVRLTLRQDSGKWSTCGSTKGVPYVANQWVDFEIICHHLKSGQYPVTFTTNGNVTENWWGGDPQTGNWKIALNGIGYDGKGTIVTDFSKREVWLGPHQIESNGDRRDFIPVRVGTVGAMYDRANPHGGPNGNGLYFSNGRVSFGVGPDVATPVMGLHFTRPYVAEHTARDYVQDGLVALFDAIENKGWGVHDPSAKSWVDLTGNEQALSFASSGSVKWDGKSMKCTGWAYNTAKSRSYLNGLTVEWISPGDLYDRMRPYDALAGYSFPQTYLLRFGVFGSGPSDTRFDGIRTAVSGARSATMAVEPGGCTLYINDKVKSYHVNKAFTKLYGSARIQIGQIVNAANTQAHCFRLYNRALTAEEIIHNHAIDVERFGIPWGGQ